MPRPRPGDVLEMRLENGIAYLHYLGEHRDYGSVIRVLQHAGSPGEATEAARTSEGYVAFFPVQAAVSAGDASVVAQVEDGCVVPTRLRRRGLIDGNGQFQSWIIEEGEREWVVKTLSSLERHLPIVSVWNREMLQWRIEEGWTPEREG